MSAFHPGIFLDRIWEVVYLLIKLHKVCYYQEAGQDRLSWEKEDCPGYVERTAPVDGLASMIINTSLLQKVLRT